MDISYQELISYWQYILLAAIILLGVIFDVLDKKSRRKIRVGFEYQAMPEMQPIPIRTKEKGFWGAIFLWLLGVRKWRITKDFYYKIDGEWFVVPAGFEFDGASVPKFLATFLSPVGVLLIGGLVHDYAYMYGTLLKKDKKSTLGPISQKKADKIFRDINIENNGFVALNYLAYYALRLAGFVAWNGHRKRN